MRHYYKNIDEFRKFYKEKYPNSNLIIPIQEYINNKMKIKVICPDHGEFQIVPSSLLKGYGCPKCVYEKGGKIYKYDLNTFKKRYFELFPDSQYIIPDQEYVNGKIKIKVICPKHGEFQIRPNDLLSGKNCKKCSI